LDIMVQDIEHTLNKVLRPLYEELYTAEENRQ
jgi:hypothetical protein